MRTRTWYNVKHTWRSCETLVGELHMYLASNQRRTRASKIPGSKNAPMQTKSATDVPFTLQATKITQAYKRDQRAENSTIASCGCVEDTINTYKTTTDT